MIELPKSKNSMKKQSVFLQKDSLFFFIKKIVPILPGCSISYLGSTNHNSE